jgi:hypothetical protein
MHKILSALVFAFDTYLLRGDYMSKKIVMNPNVIQKFKWGGTNLDWTDEAEKLSNQLETMEYINNTLTDEEKEKIIHPEG